MEEKLNSLADELIQIVEQSLPSDPLQQLQVLIQAMVRWTARYAGVAELLGIGIGALQAAREIAEKHFAAKKPS